MGKNVNSSDEESKPTVAKTPVELQRFKLEKLMKNPDKPVVIPERVKEKKMPHVPEFVRNVMGSSAGAGSGEFHVYRHLRRKEYARQKFIQEKSEKQLLEEAYHQKLLDNMQAAEERTAKKRAKRLRKRENYKKKKLNKSAGSKTDSKNGPSNNESDSENTTDSDSGNDKNHSSADEVKAKQEHSISERTSVCENKPLEASLEDVDNVEDSTKESEISDISQCETIKETNSESRQKLILHKEEESAT